jgi:hypothetical protein
MNRIIFTFLFFILTGCQLYSQQNFAISFKLSTLGFGLDGVTSLSNNVNIKAGGNLFFYNFNGGGGAKEDFKYDADARLLSFSSMVDWFPFENQVRFSGGLFYNLNRSDIDLFPARSHTISGRTYTPEELGKMSGSVYFPAVAPYVGVGYGNPFAFDNIGFSADLGLMYQSSPEVDLIATGLLTPSSEQAPVIKENLEWFRFYPILTVALTYKF